jgi:hypothetical protein
LGQQKEAYASDNEHGSWHQRQNTLLLIWKWKDTQGISVCSSW